MAALLRSRGRQIFGAFLIGLIIAVLAGTQISRAEERPVMGLAPGFVGYDISYPQCDGSRPREPIAFAVIGVNGGKQFTGNRCLQQQFEWAKTGAFEPAVYINTNSPKVRSLSARFGPAGVCEPHDESCMAYNWGYNGARYAVTYANNHGVNPRTWWLDVETMNYWSPNKDHNARVINGAIDFLKERGYEAGLYSTPYQWNTIAGSYAPGLPVWTAGARNLAEAKGRCVPKYAFGGGHVRMVQWVEKFDTNYVCP